MTPSQLHAQGSPDNIHNIRVSYKEGHFCSSITDGGRKPAPPKIMLPSLFPFDHTASTVLYLTTFSHSTHLTSTSPSGQVVTSRLGPPTNCKTGFLLCHQCGNSYSLLLEVDTIRVSSLRDAEHKRQRSMLWSYLKTSLARDKDKHTD